MRPSLASAAVALLMVIACGSTSPSAPQGPSVASVAVQVSSVMFWCPLEIYQMDTLDSPTFVVALRSDHPAAGRKLTAEALAGLSYLEISSSGEDASFVDSWLGARGLGKTYYAFQAEVT